MAFTQDPFVEESQGANIPTKTRRSKCKFKESVIRRHAQVAQKSIMHVVYLVEQPRRSVRISSRVYLQTEPRYGC